MDIFILYLFVCPLYVVVSSIYTGTTRQNGPVSSYIGAEKTAQLLSFIQKMREEQKNYPFRSGHREEKEETKESNAPSVMESMKLLQKNYDTGKKYDAEHSARKFNVQVISNPEVLELYRKQNARRNGRENITDQHPIGAVRMQVISNPEVLDVYRNMHARKYEEPEISLDRQRSYGEELKNSRISMHLLKKPEGVDFRRRHKKVKVKSKSTSDSSSKSEGDDISVSSSSDSDLRRSVVHFRVDEDLDNGEYNFNHNSDDVTDVTLKPEEAFDIVKPFIVEIFNKLKEKNVEEAKDDNPKSDDDDFYDPKKVQSSVSESEENNKKVIKLNLNDITTNSPSRIWSQYTVQRDSDNDEKQLKYLKNKLLPFPTTPDQVDLEDSWRKKEKVKKIFMNDNISVDKVNSRESRGRNQEEDDNWRSKKLPASKKSFVEPTLTHEDTWDDKGYGYWKKTDWEKKIEKGSSIETHDNNKKGSEENIRDDTNKKNKRNESKERKKSEGGKSDEVWNNPKKGNKKGGGWQKSRMKKDDWDSPKKDKEDWDSPKKKTDNWDNPKKKTDDWDSPKKKDDDWDSPKKKIDDWDKPKKKLDDWDSPKKKKDDWDSPKKKNDDWDSPKKKTDDWDSPKKKNDDWDKPIKKNDDWDQPKSKHGSDWDKGDNWDKKKDSYSKKDDDWDKKDTKSEKKLPDNKNRDKGWDMVGLDNGKKSGEKSYGSKKKSLYSEWGNYESFRNTKDKSKEKNTNKEMKEEDYKDDIKPKKKSEWDSFVPKHNYDKPRKAKTYDSYEKRSGKSGGNFGSGFGGRTSIPIVGKKSVYAD